MPLPIHPPPSPPLTPIAIFLFHHARQAPPPKQSPSVPPSLLFHPYPSTSLPLPPSAAAFPPHPRTLQQPPHHACPRTTTQPHSEKFLVLSLSRATTNTQKPRTPRNASPLVAQFVMLCLQEHHRNHEHPGTHLPSGTPAYHFTLLPFVAQFVMLLLQDHHSARQHCQKNTSKTTQSIHSITSVFRLAGADPPPPPTDQMCVSLWG